ncbi:unnamed protein product [Cuscuta campestris]|uniref:Uncharacterized protein n=1 Tax=Cuscuta campestris TaxID=132261 RepID=A0A484MZQ7_9ASTE|nr:unnamed protein product [Cuscuta campestris]
MMTWHSDPQNASVALTDPPLLTGPPPPPLKWHSLLLLLPLSPSSLDCNSVINNSFLMWKISQSCNHRAY